MKVLLTGSSGFLGEHILTTLSEENVVITLSRRNASLEVDLAKQIPSLPKIDLVVHCAGKAHFVPRTEDEKQAFFDTNVKGTENLLTGLNAQPPTSFIFISTVAVYGCESGINIKETYPLKADDAYGKSKIVAEQLIQNWCKDHGVICSILRLPLLVGKNPPGNLGAMIKGIKKGYYFNVGGGTAKKSMVMASDVADILLRVSRTGGVYNLTDGRNPSFAELSFKITNQLNKKAPLNMPIYLAKAIAWLGNLKGNTAPLNTKKLNKITSDLTFDDSKARRELNWAPKSIVEFFKI